MAKAHGSLAAILASAVCGLLVASAGIDLACAADDTGWVAVGADSYHGDLGAKFDAGKLGMCTVFADRVSGDAYLLGWEHGLLKSTDGGHTFARVDDGQVSGSNCGPSTAYSAQISPLGQKIAVFNMFYAHKGPSGYSLDGGVTWEEFAHAPHDRDFELGAFDWESKAALAVPHESNNGLYFSANGGKAWTQLAKSGGNRPCKEAQIVGLGVLGPKTLLVGYVNRIERSEDAGETWVKVSDFGSVGQAVRFADRIWWLTRPGNGKQGILTSVDEGRAWGLQGSPLPDDAGEVWVGPFFGKDENSIVVAGTQGFFATSDGCRTWTKIAPLPGRFDMKWMGCGATYDPIHGILYACNRGNALMKYQLARP
jgi:photosystem II stability/assembly factor-like uncharacterized protein